MDVSRSIKQAVKTGKVVLGFKEAERSVKMGRGQLIIISRNCPADNARVLIHNAQLSRIPVYVYPGTSLDLGALCERPHPVSAMTVHEPGDSDIMQLTK